MPAQSKDGTSLHTAYIGNPDPVFITQAIDRSGVTRMLTEPGTDVSALKRTRAGRRGGDDGENDEDEDAEEDARRRRRRRREEEDEWTV